MKAKGPPHNSLMDASSQTNSMAQQEGINSVKKEQGDFF